MQCISVPEIQAVKFTHYLIVNQAQVVLHRLVKNGVVELNALRLSGIC